MSWPEAVVIAASILGGVILIGIGALVYIVRSDAHDPFPDPFGKKERRR